MKRQRRFCDVSHPERRPVDATGHPRVAVPGGSPSAMVERVSVCTTTATLSVCRMTMLVVVLYCTVFAVSLCIGYCRVCTTVV